MAIDVIDFGANTKLDASILIGIRGVIRSGDLNDYRTEQQSGWWYIAANYAAVTNCPENASYSHLCVVSTSNGADTDAVTQIIVNNLGIWYRSRTGSPSVWGGWKRIQGTSV